LVAREIDVGPDFELVRARGQLHGIRHGKRLAVEKPRQNGSPADGDAFGDELRRSHRGIQPLPPGRGESHSQLVGQARGRRGHSERARDVPRLEPGSAPVGGIPAQQRAVFRPAGKARSHHHGIDVRELPVGSAQPVATLPSPEHRAG
jgi:hypothetical protein